VENWNDGILENPTKEREWGDFLGLAIFIFWGALFKKCVASDLLEGLKNLEIWKQILMGQPVSRSTWRLSTGEIPPASL
jgi:hypothetical protein